MVNSVSLAAEEEKSLINSGFGIMKIPILPFIGLLFIACSQPQKMETKTAINYPETRKDSLSDDYFGTIVKAPYRWLENDTSKETEAWVKAENKVTRAYLDQIPYRDSIKTRLSELYNSPRYSAPVQIGDYYFFYKNDGLQNQAVIYYQKGLDGSPEVFIDPNTLSEKGTVAINLLGGSDDYKYITYSQSQAGSDWSEIHIREIATNKELPDTLRWVKFTEIAWYKDGFYYSRYPAPKKGTELSADNKYHSVYFHKIGTSQDADALFFRDDASPDNYNWCGITENKEYLFMYSAVGTDGFETYIKDLKNNGPLTKICSGFKNKTTIIDFEDGKFYALTDINAPNYRVVTFTPDSTDSEAWKDLIPESRETLTGVQTGGGYLFADYLKNATSAVIQYKHDGTKVRSIEFPVPGTVSGFSGKPEYKTLFYNFTSFTYPSTVFKYDVETGKSEVFHQPELKFDPENFVSKQVWYPSKDGTKIPMFVVYKKGLELNGENPTLLYAYGGFNVSYSPSFNNSNMFFLENGGVYVLANLRGGGEFGEEWHKQGMKEKKQNVFNDFIAAAEYLIQEKYTSSKKLAIEGGSNGGLLVGAVMTQRPDLFAVALPHVGVMDMLRFQKFTVGKGWIPEYGSAENSVEEFQYLYAYSPLHNIKDNTEYPSTMIFTGDHDDRVVPAHSFKFAARLQAAQKGPNPVLIRIETDAGHGAGKPISMYIDEHADKWAFTLYEMGVKSLVEKPAKIE